MRRLAIITLVALAASGDARAQGVPTLGPAEPEQLWVTADLAEPDGHRYF